MIPLQDENPTETVPFITTSLIGLNCLVFGFQLSLNFRAGLPLETFVRTWGFIPASIATGMDAHEILTVITSMFLHGSALHLVSNLLFLWVFGDNIEDELGHLNFLLFYIGAGIVASACQFVVDPTSTIPMIGASGAISGVIAAYLLLYPGARVLTAIILVIFIQLVYVPAWVLLGFWILIQVIEASTSLGLEETGTRVAWFAHLGGFSAGFVTSLILLFKRRFAGGQ